MSSTATNPAVDGVIERVRKVYGSWTRETTVARMRQDWDELFGGVPVNAQIEDVDAGGVKAQWVTAPGADARRGRLADTRATDHAPLPLPSAPGAPLRRPGRRSLHPLKAFFYR